MKPRLQTEEERRFVDTLTRSQQHQLNLMLWIKLFPCLGYFPGVDEIPSAIVTHVRKALSLPEELVPAYEEGVSPEALSEDDGASEEMSA